MVNFNNKRVRKKIERYVLKHYEPIEVKGGLCKWNFRCHNNAVHEAVVNNQEKIAMCVYFDESYPIIHFLNYNGTDFVDNTLGVWANEFDYYFVEWIEKEDFFNVYDYHDKQRKLFGDILNWWERLTSDYRG